MTSPCPGPRARQGRAWCPTKRWSSGGHGVPADLLRAPRKHPPPPAPHAQERAPRPPPLLALLEATKRLSPPAPERPKSSDALAGLPIPKEAEAALQAFPHYRPQAQDAAPHEAREMLLREALKPGGYILHPEAPSTHAHNPTPLLEAWRLHLTRGERVVPALKEELAARLKRLAALWPKYQRAKDKQRRWELESLIHLEGSEVRRLGSFFTTFRWCNPPFRGPPLRSWPRSWTGACGANWTRPAKTRRNRPSTCGRRWPRTRSAS